MSIDERVANLHTKFMRGSSKSSIAISVFKVRNTIVKLIRTRTKIVPIKAREGEAISRRNFKEGN